jgi:hypothetical protein
MSVRLSACCRAATSLRSDLLEPLDLRLLRVALFLPRGRRAVRGLQLELRFVA